MNKFVLKRAINISWIILLVYLVLKLFGFQYFKLDTKFDFINNNKFICTLIGSITSYILFTIYYLAICRKTHFRFPTHIALVFYFILCSFLKLNVLKQQYHILFDIISNFVLPFLLMTFSKNCKKEYARIAYAFAINCGFQSISVMIRSVNVNIIVESFISQLIMTIDVLIMLILFWLYSIYNLKEEEKL